MAAGRTSWWPKDAAFHRRELVVELGEEFASAGPNVIDVLCAWAQEQRGSGEIRGGFRALARESFVSLDEAQAIVNRAGAIGLLDDLSLDADGRRFSCRVSGWEADQSRGRAALRKADERARTSVTPCHDESRPVTVSALPDQTRPDPTTTEAATPQRDARKTDTSRSQAETVACPRCQAPAGEKCDGVRGKRESCHLERHHAVGELTHVKGRKPAAAGPKPSDVALAASRAREAEAAQMAEHFPGVELAIVRNAARRLVLQGEAPTVEAIRAELEVDAA